MPRRVTVEMKCDRCPAVWFVDYVAGKPEPITTSVEIKITHPVDGQVSADRIVRYEILCERCVRAVLNYVNSVELDPEARRKPKPRKSGASTPAAPEGGDIQSRPPLVPPLTQPVETGEVRKSYASGHTRSNGPRVPSSQSGS